MRATQPSRCLCPKNQETFFLKVRACIIGPAPSSAIAPKAKRLPSTSLPQADLHLQVPLQVKVLIMVPRSNLCPRKSMASRN
ncbi:unnamed protein product [Prunus brigantina]